MSKILKLFFIVEGVCSAVAAVSSAITGHVMLTVLDLMVCCISVAFVLNIGEEILDNE